MVRPVYTIIWTKRAQQQLHSIFIYIQKDSEQQARKVVKEIAEAVDQARFNPEHYNADKYKLNNDGSYRAFEKYHYRISYVVKEDQIVVLRIRHTSRMPKEH